MKKFARIALTACLLLGIAAQANAVDFKIKGRWISLFDYGQNGNMTGGNGSTGYAKGFDNFEALQRWRIQLDAVASENLSGTVHFEIGKHRWGQASTGGQLGSDSNMVRLKHAYIDWRVPETDLKLRMGIQAINLPGFATDSQVMGSDVAGITASYTFNDNVGLTAFWARAYNDNFLGSDDDAPNNKQNFMDNVDFFGLVLPLTFEGARITPWVMGGMIGPNAFRTQDGYLTNIANCYFVPNLTALNYGFHGNKAHRLRHGLLGRPDRRGHGLRSLPPGLGLQLRLRHLRRRRRQPPRLAGLGTAGIQAGLGHPRHRRLVRIRR